VASGCTRSQRGCPNCGADLDVFRRKQAAGRRNIAIACTALVIFDLVAPDVILAAISF
jgi:hypothetical protein